MTTLFVSEMFGPTFQGEGASLGKRCIFLRLSGCNLECVWCDTPYTWDFSGKVQGREYDQKIEVHPMEIYEVVAAMGKLDNNAMWVISGGEPMLQAKAIRELLKSYGGEVEIETNGTIDPRALVEAVHADRPGSVDFVFNVSPKLKHSENDFSTPQKVIAMYRYLPIYRTLGARFKFVCQNVQDLDEIASIASMCQIPDWQIWIMPEGREAGPIERTARELSEEVLKRGWNLTTRLHVLLWGDKRGR